MKNYLLTVRFRFESLDDPNARREAERMKEAYQHAKGVTFKLQEIYDDKKPRSVPLKGEG